jgi:hypothetical protein
MTMPAGVPASIGCLLVELSEAHAEKWVPLLQQITMARLGAPLPLPPTADKYKSATRIHQRQKRLGENEIDQLIAAYRAGSTVYELAAQFGCHRKTVSGHLKSHGVRMRLTPLTEEEIDQAVHLYESGLSLVRVGKEIGSNSCTVRARLLERGVVMRPAFR